MRYPVAPQVHMVFKVLVTLDLTFSAAERTRTSKGLLPLAPQASASASFATAALSNLLTSLLLPRATSSLIGQSKFHSGLYPKLPPQLAQSEELIVVEAPYTLPTRNSGSLSSFCGGAIRRIAGFLC
jgi:hypothetical protein